MSDFINRNLGRLDELQFFDSQTVKVEQTTRGTRFHVKSPNISQHLSLPITGEYNPTKNYNLGDICIVSLGANAGTYVRITSVTTPNQPPWVGNNFWMQLPLGTTTGVWM